MKVVIWSAVLPEHPEGRSDLGHADEALRGVQKALTNLGHADERTWKWRFSHWSLTLLQMCLYCLLLSGPEAWELGQSANVSESRHAVQHVSVNVFSHLTETQHRVLLLYNKEEIKRVWLKCWLESFIYYTLLRILWQLIQSPNMMEECWTIMHAFIYMLTAEYVWQYYE